jgi:hypothetical protein
MQRAELQMASPALALIFAGTWEGNVIEGPGLYNLDFSAVENNYIRRISEAFNVQFRAEFFNVLSRTNFAPSGVNAPTGGDLELYSNVEHWFPDSVG